MFLKSINTQYKSVWSPKLLWLLIVIAPVLFFASCKNDKKVATDKEVYYTCSMHPQIKEPKAGKCPICGMNLIQVQKTQAPKSNELQLSDLQMQLGNIVV